MSTPAPWGARVSPKDIFVGRQELFNALKGHLAPREACIADAYGVRGIGKSCFLDQLARYARVHIAGGIVLTHSATELGDVQSIAMALQRFCSFLEQVRDSVVQQSGDERRTRRRFEKFDLAVRAARSELEFLAIKIENEVKAASIGEGAQVQSTSISLSHELFREDAERRRAGITGSFAEALRAISKERAVLWEIDDYDAVAGQRMGDWLLDLVSDIDGGLVVLSRLPTAQEPSPAAEIVLHKPVGPLSGDEVREYLERCLDGEALADGVAAVAMQFTDGHPGMLALVAEMLQHDLALAHDRARLEASFRQLPRDMHEREIRLVETIVPPSERAAVEACAVARRFDADLLAHLLGEDVRFVEATIAQLHRHTFVERKVDEDTGSYVYRLHAFVRHGMDEKLRDGSPQRYAALHQRAADFYFRWLVDFDEIEARSSGDYGGWYRYDDRRWQRHMREWLYHQALAERAACGGLLERRRQVSRVRFARVFLDAFWWWGCYVPFPFCRELIDDWEATQQDPGWVEDVKRLLNHYPTGWRKHEASSWDDIRRALVGIRRACGLEGRLGSLSTTDHRHTRALIDLFLAHAARYRAPADEADAARLYGDAVRYYGEALQLFRMDEDASQCAWTLFERADVHSEHDAEEQALADWNAAVATMQAAEIDDEELTADLHRVMGDIEWRRGRAAEALARTGAAVTHAYLFQNRPHPPDVYTADFFQEMVERTRRRVREVWPRPDRQAAIGALLATPLVACRHDDRAVAGALEASDPDAVLRLLPEGPCDADLGLDRSPFLDDWSDVCEALEREPGFELQTVQ